MLKSLRIPVLILLTTLLSCSKNEPDPIQYTITITASEGGSVSNNGGIFEEGETLNVEASPNTNYIFTGWSDGFTNSSRSILINSNLSLQANFELRKYPLTINIIGEGEITEEIVNTGKTTDYNSGSTIKLTANSSNGWIFEKWTGAIESIENPVSIIIDSNKEIDFNKKIIINKINQLIK